MKLSTTQQGIGWMFLSFPLQPQQSGMKCSQVTEDHMKGKARGGGYKGHTNPPLQVLANGLTVAWSVNVQVNLQPDLLGFASHACPVMLPETLE